MYDYDYMIGNMVSLAAEEDLPDGRIELGVVDDVAMLVQIVPLHQFDVRLVDLLHGLVQMLLVRPHRTDQDEFDAIDGFEQVELVLLGAEVLELGGLLGMDLLDEGAQTLGEPLAILDAVGVGEFLVVVGAVGEVGVVEEGVLLPDHELVHLLLHIIDY